MYRYLLIVIVSVLFVNCKAVIVKQEIQRRTEQNISLGTIGEQKNFALEQDYNHTALPKYLKPIKIQVNSVVFNASTYKAYKKAKLFQDKNVQVNYIDSIKLKPTFLKLEIADRVSVLSILQSDENKAVFQFLKNKNEAHIVTAISVAFNIDIIRILTNAEEVFLEQTGIDSYALKVYKNRVETHIIRFTDGVVFSHQTSNACWKENDKYQLEIIDLVERNDKCPSKSYRSSKRAKRKINYFKFQ